MGAIEIRDFSLDEVSSVATFFHEQWRPNHIFWRNRELLLWQYRDNPVAARFSPGLTFRGAWEDGRNVGVFGYMPFAFNLYGRKSYGCHLSAWWVHPEHRRGSLGLQLLHSLQENSPFDACIAGINTPVAEKLYERMGWVVVRAIPRLVYVTDSSRFHELLAPEAQTHAVFSGGFDRESFRSRDSTDGIEVSPLESFAALGELGWDDFYWREVAPPRMGPAREAAYLAWRYEKIPLFQYRGLLARRGPQIEGLLVYRIEEVKDSDHRIVRIVDLAAGANAMPALAGAVQRAAADAGATFVDFFCTDQRCSDVLKRCGFVDACNGNGEAYWLPHLFQPLDHTRNRLNTSWWVRGMDLKTRSARADFCLMKGDYEFDRPN
jgi:GNAT superfamily N-acetyltransferase